MRQVSKLSRVLATLDRKQRSAFRKFLQSPYFNHRTDPIDLFEFLHHRPQASSQAIWAGVYPDTAFDQAEFNRLSSRLLKLIEQFIALQERHPDPIADGTALAEHYLRKGLEALALAKLQHVDKVLDAQSQRGPEHWRDRFQVAQLRYKASARVGNRFGQGLPVLGDSLDNWFVIEKLKQACSLVAQQNVSEAEGNLELLEGVMQWIEGRDLQKQPGIAVYLRAYRMMVDSPSKPHYQALRQLLLDHKAQLLLEDRRAVSLMAINYCIQCINTGDQAYLGELYGLYQIGLAEQWLFENGELSPWTYKNIVSAGLKIEDYEGVGKFIEEHRQYLPEESRAAFYSYNLAELQFAKGAFSEVLRTLRYLQFKEPLTQLRVRILQIKAAYELGEKGLVEYQIANLLKTLRRKKSLPYHRDIYRNFARFAMRLLLLWEGDAGAREMLQTDLQKGEAVVEQEWLLEKLSEN